MRTRFLAVDFFSAQTLASSSSSSSVTSLFLPVPVPPVPDLPPPPPPAAAAAFHGFEYFEVSLSYECDAASIGSAGTLTWFLEEVLPGSSLLEASVAEVETAKIKDAWYSGGAITADYAEGLEAEITRQKEDARTQDFRVVLFEGPEPLDCSLDNFLACEEGSGILLENPHVFIKEDHLLVKYKDVIPFPRETVESVYSIDQLSALYHENCSTVNMDDSEEAKKKKSPNQHKIICFEELEIDLDTASTDFSKEGFQFLLSGIELDECPNTYIESDIRFISDFDASNVLHSLSEVDGQPESLLSPPICVISLLELDFVSLPKNHEADGSIFPLLIPVQFGEIDLLDLVCFQTFNYAASRFEISEELYGEDMKLLECMYDSLVNDEIALPDPQFVSFPAPAICGTEEESSISLVFCSITSRLKEHSASACDEIYLDWHLFQQDTCTNHIWSTCSRILYELDPLQFIESIKSTDEKEILDFVLYNDSGENLDRLPSKEGNKRFLPAVSPVNEADSGEKLDRLPSKEGNKRFLPVVSPVNEADTVNKEKHLSENENQLQGIRTETGSENSHKVCIKSYENIINAEDTTQSNDLSFYLSSRKCPNGRSNSLDKFDSRNDAVNLPTVPGPVTNVKPEVKLLSVDIEVHSVKLSQDISDLVDDLGRFYLRQLKIKKDLRKKNTLEDEFELLRLSKQELKEIIKAKSLTSSFEDTIIVEYVELYVIKQMVCYICFYGVALCQQYLKHILLHFQPLTIKLSSIYEKIENAQDKTEKKIIESHPSLSAFEEILRPVSIRKKNKLIIAEKVIWYSLGQKLTAMGISFQKLDDGRIWNGVLEFVFEALNRSNCLLISHEHVSVSFPFDKFSIVVEYGGACGSSRISNYYSEIRGMTQVHFIKVELDKLSIASSFCEGFKTLPLVEDNKKGTHPVSERKEVANCQHQLALLDFEPVLEDPCVSSLRPSDVKKGCVEQGSTDVVLPDTYVQPRDESVSYAPETIVIVNTGKFEKEMIMARRSSYQKILKLEKEGVQVVERDYVLPVDVIFSAGSCLVWYRQQDLAASCLTDSMENIATRTLMSISFAFGGCFLVFEGDSCFLDAVMDSADGLYAAAASLDIHLQLFCSYSLDLTDEIILNGIRNAKAINSGLYPPMPECESLGESFLTSFPSINPFSAHAILSSVGTLKELFNWVHEERLQSLEKYLVPQEMTSTFSDLCRYGELGESKSGTTDCSSVSSAIDSGNSSSKLQYKRKSQNVTDDNGWTFDPQHVRQGGRSKTVSNEQAVAYREPVRLDLFEQNECTEHNGGRDIPLAVACGAADMCYGNSTMSVQDTGNGEIVDCDGSELDIAFTAGENPRSTRRRLNFIMSDYPTFPSSAEVERNTVVQAPFRGLDSIDNKVLKVTGRNSAGWASEFTQQADLEFGRKQAHCKSKSAVYSSLANVDTRTPCRDYGKVSKDDKADDDLLLGMEAFPIELSGDLFGDRAVHGGYEKILPPKSSEPSSGRKLLSNAIHAAQMRQGSPWTIDFLNKIKEKTKKHQDSLQSLQCNTCSDCPPSSGKIDRYFNRQRPSCHDSFKYRGVSREQKVVSGKQQKRRRQSLDFGNIEKPGRPSLDSRTPLDKRARQVLTYARNGNEKQSKLVWTDGSFRSLGSTRVDHEQKLDRIVEDGTTDSA